MWSHFQETRQVAVPLIKAFQREVDGLNARSQVAETALIEICSQLTNLPGWRFFQILKMPKL